MKRFVSMLFVIIGCIALTGCSFNKEEKLSLKEKIGKSYEYYDNIKCNDIDNIIDLDFAGFVTKNRAYELNIDKVYSNEENCKEVPIENLDDEIILGSGWNIVYTKKYAYSIGKNMRKGVYKNNEYTLFSQLGTNVIYHNSKVKSGYYIVSVDNKIKMIKTISREEENNISKTIDINYNFDDDEQVLSISEYFIKTNKAFYKVKNYKENKEECEKYADVNCKYGFKITKDKTLTNNYNDILFAGYYIIDKDHNVYYYKKS